MKLYIYIILFVLLIIYINRHSSYLENFTDNDFNKHYYDAPNPYTVLKTDDIKPILIDANSNVIPGWDINNHSLYKDKFWFLKNKGFSDIYNYEDKGSEIIFDMVNGYDNVIQQQPNKLVKPIDEIKISNSQIPIEFNYKDSNYSLLGTANNKYFNQYFLIYEHETKSKLKNTMIDEELEYIKNNKIFEYTLVKIDNNKPHVIHYIGPRVKINIGDVVYLSLATFQLGPLIINKIN